MEEGVLEVIVAENAGFCFGVKRAAESIEKKLLQKNENEKIYTLGKLIHNDIYNEYLAERGVRVATAEDLLAICDGANRNSPVTVFVRAHGIERETEELLFELSKKNPDFHFVDCTCPYVKKIHRIAAENSSDDHYFLLMGAANHPEVVGIMSYFEGEKYVVADGNALEEVLLTKAVDKMHKKVPVMAAQTTFNLLNWHQSQKK